MSPPSLLVATFNKNDLEQIAYQLKSKLTISLKFFSVPSNYTAVFQSHCTNSDDVPEAIRPICHDQSTATVAHIRLIAGRIF